MMDKDKATHDNTGDIIIKDRFNYAKLKNDFGLPLIVIYYQPKDYPDYYVARVWDLNHPTRLIGLGKDYAEIKSMIPEGLIWMPRNRNDDPCIVETWG